MLVPFVGDWGRKHGVPASKLLMPLSWAAILGGMTTLVGTSTNLVVNSLVIGSGLGSLSMLDFTPVGLMIAITGLAYILLAGYRLLPSRKDPVSILEENDREYLVEALVGPDSPLSGRTVEQAAHGGLQGLNVAELFRDGRTIAPVGPDEVLRAGDRLILAGNTSKVADLLKDRRGLTYSERFDPPGHGTLKVVESVVSSSSSLVNRKIRETDFRATWDASILAVHRQGERLSGKIGEVRLKPGDLLLLVTGGDFEKAARHSDDLFVISMIGEIRKVNIPKALFILASSFACLVLSAVGLVPLFTSLLVLLAAYLILNLVTLQDLRDSLNIDLLAIAAFSLAIGTAVQKSGLAASLSGVVVEAFQPLGVVGVLAAVYLVTSILTEFITNAAAASIIFPFAAASAAAMGVQCTPFFLAVAFGASSSFITPIGYQTNLIIFGPGGYRFSDFLRAGLPLKVLCAAVAVTGLSLWYGLL
jgi:di/tricarboxylate transporter